jgi:hypothetical protein
VALRSGVMIRYNQKVVSVFCHFHCYAASFKRNYLNNLVNDDQKDTILQNNLKRLFL